MSENKNEGSTIIIIIWVLTIAVFIIAGIMAWNWIQPKNFFGGLLFLCAWGGISYVAHIIIGGILYAIFDK